MNVTSATKFREEFRDFTGFDQGSCVVTRRGRPVGVFVSIADPDELDRLSLLMSPKFQKFLAEARDDIQARRLIPQDEFWRRVEAETAKPKRTHKKSKSKVKP